MKYELSLFEVSKSLSIGRRAPESEKGRTVARAYFLHEKGC